MTNWRRTLVAVLAAVAGLFVAAGAHDRRELPVGPERRALLRAPDRGPRVSRRRSHADANTGPQTHTTPRPRHTPTGGPDPDGVPERRWFRP